MATLRTAGLSALLPAMDWGNAPVQLELCGYSPGSRATFEVRAGEHRFALKLYAEDPAPEVALYRALADAGFASDTGARVPKLLDWDPNLRTFAISWLDGYPVNELIKAGRGRRAGTVTAEWFRQIAARPVNLGPPLGSEEVLARCGQYVDTLTVIDRALGTAAAKVIGVLRAARPESRRLGLVQGTLYSRHVFDMGNGPGLIDWQRFGQGPAELDAGMFLATVWRRSLRRGDRAGQAAAAERAFLRRIRDLVDPETLLWYRSVSLVHLAARAVRRGPITKIAPLLREAERFAHGFARDGADDHLEVAAGGRSRSRWRWSHD